MEIIQAIDKSQLLAGLVLLLVPWVFGLPQRWLSSIAAFLKRGRIRRRTAMGLYDDATLRDATQYYVRPKYASVDPAEFAEPADSLLNARADLFEIMKAFLAKKTSDSKYLLVLGDSGMGKTSFLLNYFEYNYRLLNLRKRNLLLVSLSQPDPDRLIDNVALADQPNTDLFLDAFDEDPLAIGRAEKRMQELLSKCHRFRTVTISSRTQFFSSEESVPAETGIAKPGAVPLGESKHYRFSRAYIAPFDDSQVNKYLRLRYPGVWNLRARNKARAVIAQVPSLSVRPMLLSHMPEILGTQMRIRSTLDVYHAMVQAWVKRESKWIDSTELHNLSEFLALDFYAHRKERGGEFADPEYIVKAARATGCKAIGDHITARSLLNRNAAGMFKFAHRSILEYFVAMYVANGGTGLQFELTDQMAKFVAQRLGCYSKDVEVFLASCRLVVAVSAPEKALGHATNYGLYREIGAIAGDSLMSARANIPGFGSRGKLGDMIHAYAAEAVEVPSAKVTQVRMVLKNIELGSERTEVRFGVWLGAISVFFKAQIHTYDLVNALGLHALQRTELLITATVNRETKANSAENSSPRLPQSSGGVPSGLTWTVGSRNAVIAQMQHKGLDLSALNNNPAVSFELNPDGDLLLITLVEGHVDAEGPLVEYGILAGYEAYPSQSALILGPTKLPHGSATPDGVRYP